jgi:hypothetical protein
VRCGPCDLTACWSAVINEQGGVCSALAIVFCRHVRRSAGDAGYRPEPAGEPTGAHPRHGREARRPGPDGQIARGSAGDSHPRPNLTVAYLVKKSLGDIKAGDFVASTSRKGTDGKNHSVELRIFPEAMRGLGEGQYAWDLAPESLMTNATVSGVTDAPQGQTLRVTYKGGESELVVGPDTPILGYGSGDMSLLKPGAAVFIVAQKQPDGSLTATRVTAEKDGVKPPM